MDKHKASAKDISLIAITIDFHPDPFYKTYSDTSKDGACHKGDGAAGIYGAELSDCDAPIALVNATFDWIDAELKNDIDFVVWTGDSARHDNDEDLPRNTKQVVELNELLVAKFVEVFGKQDNINDTDPTNDLIVPIVPTFGNNDILPHNIFTKGPNKWTRDYASIWRTFIPEEQRHQFAQGGWFSVEVIPNHLTVFSLNSLYFFDSNSAVDGCAAPSEPGYRQLEWLRIQLQFIRERGMKAMIIGHVPPARTESKEAWDESCWQKYALWMKQYRDVVVGSIYGHMNTDHFIIQDFEDIDKDVQDGYETKLKSKRMSIMPGDDEVHVNVGANYLIELRDAWSKLPKLKAGKALLDWVTDTEDVEEPEMEAEKKKDKKKKKKGKKGKKHGKDDVKKYLEAIGGPFAERFSISHVSPSVVPNYYPTIRVYEYNITGVRPGTQRLVESDVQESEAVIVEEWLKTTMPEAVEQIEDGTVEVSRKKNKKRRFRLPEPPSASAPPGPAYSPQSLSLLGFTQYYANITRINNDFVLDEQSVASEFDGDAAGAEDLTESKWKNGKHHGKKPHDRDHTPNPKKFRYGVLYDTRNDTVYDMADLSVRSYLGLAQRIGGFRPKKSAVEYADASGEVGERAREEDAVSKPDGTVGEDDEGWVAWLVGRKGTKGKKHGKKKHGKSGKKRNDEPWYTFVRRAFVETIEPGDLEDQFGH